MSRGQRDKLRAAALPAGFRLCGVSWMWRPWAVFVTLVLVGVGFVLFCASVSLGDYPISMWHVVRTLFGAGDKVSSFIIVDLRLPRAIVGVAAGAALGMAGAIVQSIARNPLASPDVLGITGGASVAAVLLTTTTGTATSAIMQTVGLPVAALIGGLVTGGAVYVLSWRGGIDGMRLILVGVAVTSLTSALTTWLLVTAEVQDVAAAQAWLVGSLEARGWNQVWGVVVVTAVVAVVALAASFSLRPLQCGDDVAQGLGVGVQRTRAVLLVCAVLLSGAAVSAAGPIAFVAFVSPQIVKRLTRFATPPLFASAVTGAVLLTGADLIARVIIPVPLPVGIVTAAIGGPFLVYLLVRSNVKVSA